LGATINNLAGYSDPQSYRIAFDYAKIYQVALKYKGMAPFTWAAQVVAHETGHWFQQNHSLRLQTIPPTIPPAPAGCCTFVAGGKVSNLNWSTFTIPGGSTSSGTVLIGLEQYPNGSREVLRDSVSYCSSGSAPTQVDILKNVSPPMPVYSATVSPNATPTSTLLVQNLQFELMDWTPNSQIVNPLQWHFDPANLNALCVQSPCPTQWQGTKLCQ
jgi:hypothetical protein